MVNYLTIGLVITLISIIIMFISTFYKENSLLDRFSIKLGDIVQALFLFGIILSYQTYTLSQKESVLTAQSNITDKSWTIVYDKIQNYYSYCPYFCNTLFFSWQKPAYMSNTELNIQNDNFVYILSLSMFIFQSFVGLISYFLYYDVEDSLTEWISSFLMWANSDILYDIWKQNKILYGPLTQNFVDLLFIKVREKPPTNVTDLKNISLEICHSDTVKKIFQTANKKPLCN